MSTTDIDRDDRDDDLTTAARSLHREWESPRLWPTIAARIMAGEGGGTRARVRGWTAGLRGRLAAAAAVLLAVGLSLFWLGGRLPVPPEHPAAGTAGERSLLSDPALAEIERAEAQYASAIQSLAGAAAARGDTAARSPLLASLRERLVVIDAAIAECRAEIERNRFNTHLRRQLLAIYQEKRRTLEQILELEQNAS